MNDTTFQGDGKVAYVPVVVNNKPPKQSNYDRLVSKSPEELATWIDRIQADAYERGMMETPIVDYPNIYSGWLNWLKQEASDGN